MLQSMTINISTCSINNIACYCVDMRSSWNDRNASYTFYHCNTKNSEIALIRERQRVCYREVASNLVDRLMPLQCCLSFGSDSHSIFFLHQRRLTLMLRQMRVQPIHPLLCEKLPGTYVHLWTTNTVYQKNHLEGRHHLSSKCQVHSTLLDFVAVP